jgi:hypothetical protein
VLATCTLGVFLLTQISLEGAQGALTRTRWRLALGAVMWMAPPPGQVRYFWVVWRDPAYLGTYFLRWLGRAPHGGRRFDVLLRAHARCFRLAACRDRHLTLPLSDPSAVTASFSHARRLCRGRSIRVLRSSRIGASRTDHRLLSDRPHTRSNLYHMFYRAPVDASATHGALRTHYRF